MGEAGWRAKCGRARENVRVRGTSEVIWTRDYCALTIGSRKDIIAWITNIIEPLNTTSGGHSAWCPTRSGYRYEHHERGLGEFDAVIQCLRIVHILRSMQPQVADKTLSRLLATTDRYASETLSRLLSILVRHQSPYGVVGYDRRTAILPPRCFALKCTFWTPLLRM